MANEQSNPPCDSFPMNSGDGPYSYARNSSVQKKGVDVAKALIHEAIADKLDIRQLCSPSCNLFNIVDLGCSVGPNTFFAVQNIVESVKLKVQSHGINLNTFEFQVFFNDHSSNDFNMLFKSIPSDKQYYASGVPGSFHGRLFPKASLHFVHSSYALHWLSKVPKEVVEKDSPAWNKGKIYFTSAPKEVAEAYKTQFDKDMESILNARALELVPGGLMAFLIPCVPHGSKCRLTAFFDLLGSALMDIASMGLVNEAKLDSFNLPIYLPTPQELEALIKRNGNFSIERMDPLGRAYQEDVNTRILHLRAGFEGLISEHFGNEIVDNVFNQLKTRVADSNIFLDSNYKSTIELSVVLKRNSV